MDGSMVDVFQIADWFLSKQSMNHKKLQKLCYYAQAWYTVFNNGKILFDEPIISWIHGPVIIKLYDKYKDYRWNLIPQVPADSITLDENVLDTLEAVWDCYGHCNGLELEALTRQEEPWLKARTGLNSRDPGYKAIITKDMYEFYTKQNEPSELN